MRLNKTLDALLTAANLDSGSGVFPVTQPDVNAYSRMLVRRRQEEGYAIELDNHDSYSGACQKFERAMRQERVVPADAWQELRALAWLVQNRSVLKLGLTEQQVLLNAPRFYLVAFRIESMGLLRYGACPVWRALSQTHGYFDYVPWPWQNGLKPTVVSSKGVAR